MFLALEPISGCGKHTDVDIGSFGYQRNRLFDFIGYPGLQSRLSAAMCGLLRFGPQVKSWVGVGIDQEHEERARISV